MAGTLAAREHAWGPAGEEVAVCGGGAEVRLLRPGAAAAAAGAGAGAGAGAVAAHPPSALLRGHEGPVAAVDWSPEAGLLLTGGHDRNVYVWRRAPAAEAGAGADAGSGAGTGVGSGRWCCCRRPWTGQCWRPAGLLGGENLRAEGAHAQSR